MGTVPRVTARQFVVQREHRWLEAQTVIIGLVFALPGLFVLWRTVRLGSDVPDALRQAGGPLFRTILLASSVAATTAVAGTVAAWLLERADLPGRSVLRVLLVLPLALPSFVGAAAFLAALSPNGLLHAPLDAIGLAPTGRWQGFFPAWLVLSAFTFPYVLLPVSARLLRLRPSLEETARLLGRTPLQTFREVTFPQLRPAILAGSLIVFLYTVSDFGAVQLLGYDTLTRVIFASFLSDRAASFAAAALLLILAVFIVGLERLRRPDDMDQRARAKAVPRVGLGLAAPFAWLFLLGLIAVGLIVPVVSLATWAFRGIRGGRVEIGELFAPALNTAIVGLIAAAVAVAVVVPLAITTVRYRSSVARASSVAVVGGYAVPGIVIALSLVFWSLNTPGASVLYQTFPLLIVAYVIHFGSQALGAAEGSVRAVPPQLKETGRVLDESRWYRFFKIDAALMRQGLLSGGALVLLSTIKELPATLLLAPTGFDTLATEIWGSYQEGFLADAGAASLVLIALSAVLTWALVLREE